MPPPLIQNVSDTARWVAVYRAWESARPDALFRDPFAERLAGERGRAIAELVPRQARSGWPFVLRTKLIDDLLAVSLAEGCDRVLNLAAGFDTRPYRLALPSTLSWIEADLPALIEEKEALLAQEKPACSLARERVDLADPAARGAFLDRATAGARQATVITEGLLGYLEDEEARSLARYLLARPVIRWWILDQASPEILRLMARGMGAQLSQAPLKFAPANGVAFFESLGWKARDVRSVFREAVRAKRVPFLLRIFALFPEPDPRNLGRARWSAVVRFEH